jgi:Tfp pilus assembly protein PilO
VVVVGAVAIAVCGLSVLYFQQINQYNQMKARYIQTQTNLQHVQVDRLLADRSELEAELTEMTSRYEKLESQLAEPVVSSDVTKSLFDIAGEHNLTVSRMQSSVPSSEILEGVSLYQTTLTALVEGDSAGIIDFVVALDRNFSTGVITSVDIDIADDPATENSSVGFTMCIYATGR